MDQDQGNAAGDSATQTSGSGRVESGESDTATRAGGDSSIAPRRIAILGTAPGWEAAPFKDERWEIWGISRLYTSIPRWNVWVELHPLSEVCRTWEGGDQTAERLAREEYLDWLRQNQKGVVLGHPDPMLPEAHAYPLQDVLRFYGRRYFTNTITYMLALAGLQPGVTDVGVWGVDMELDGEYGTQRPSCEWMLGRLEGMGIRVHVPQRSNLLNAGHLYAFEDVSGVLARWRSKRDDLKRRLTHNQQVLEQARMNVEGLRGALEMTEYGLKQGFWRE